MHALEKILAQAAGADSVGAGEIVNCRVDLAEVNDLYLQTIRSFREMGGERVVNPDKITFILDHYAPASTIGQAEIHKQMRQFCREQGIRLLFDVNHGVCHQVMVEKGLVRPGMVLIATDSHTTTHGAFGAFAAGVGATDLAVILRTGALWLRVPEVIEIALEGRLPPGVYAKDVILHVIGKLGADYAIYQAVEFTGPVIGQLSVSERMAICNMTTEMGAKTSYIQPDAVTLDFVKRKVSGTLTVYETDPDYAYRARHVYDVSALGPQLSIPHSVDSVAPIDAFAGTPVDQAYLGSCTGGRAEDIAVAARILKGRKVNPRTRFLVVPASRGELLASMAHGDVQALVEAGAVLVTPGCAACLGTHLGILAAEEVCIASTNRNFPGRMGHTGAKIYLGSPAAVAAAALEGRITDPRNHLG